MTPKKAKPVFSFASNAAATRTPLHSQDAMKWFEEGNQRKDENRLNDSVIAFERALQLRPDFPEVHFNLANTLATLGRMPAAERHFREALRIVPSFTRARNNLATLLQGQGRHAEARRQLDSALLLEPGNVYALNNLGNVLRDMGGCEEAVAIYRRAIGVAPQSAESHSHLALALQTLGELDEAEVEARTAVNLNAENPKSWNTLGNVLFDQLKFEESIRCYERSLALDPQFALARCNRALVHLYIGDFQRGWNDYESRWEVPNHQLPEFHQPRWDGSNLQGRTILLDWEQGLGDTLQFARYADWVKQRRGHVVLRCRRALAKLLEGTPGVDRLVLDGEQLPAFDVWSPLLSLPRIFGTTVSSIPDNVPYLQADANLVRHWGNRLAGSDRVLIGIAWQGNPDYPRDRFRSIPLREFVEVAAIPGVRLISLQKGAGSEQIAEVEQRFPVEDFEAELDEQTGPFQDTAAVMHNLDLVITVDTCLAHLAGGLGVPVCVLLSRIPEWRWLDGCDDSPWYPTMRLNRQSRLGDWKPVMKLLADEIRGLLSTDRGRGAGRENAVSVRR